METVAIKSKSKKGTLKRKINRTAMLWLNPETNGLVHYREARYLHLLDKPGIRFGVLNKKTHRLVSPKRAIKLGLQLE